MVLIGYSCCICDSYISYSAIQLTSNCSNYFRIQFIVSQSPQASNYQASLSAAEAGSCRVLSDALATPSLTSQGTKPLPFYYFLMEGGVEQKKDEIKKGIGARGFPIKPQSTNHLNPKKEIIKSRLLYFAETGSYILQCNIL